MKKDKALRFIVGAIGVTISLILFWNVIMLQTAPAFLAAILGTVAIFALILFWEARHYA